MQEEVEQRVVTLAVNCSKLTEQELKKALSKLLAQMKAHHQTKQPHGKMTVKQLAAQNRGMQSVEVTDQNRYLIFFKSQDADAMTAAFKEYTAQTVQKHSRPSVLAKLEKFKSLIQSAVVDRAKKKELER